jgi:hypothetical protein
MKNLPTIAMLCRITKSRREWEELGEMITRTTSKQHTDGATKKKDQSGMIDGQSAVGDGVKLAFTFTGASKAFMLK